MLNIKSLCGVAMALVVSVTSMSAGAERLVILHTNDTHSIVDPAYDDNLGGVMRRKAVIDSVRSAEPNVLLVDAGDVVQGSLYFTRFHGDVEQRIMNHLGYDIQIPGNHEFDNGIDGMARYYKGPKADLLSANYDFSATPMRGMFKPYVIKEIGGKRIGFMGINVDPVGLIDSAKFAPALYTDAVEAANIVAAYLKKIEKVDMVVAVTHIGYHPDKNDDPTAPVKDGDVDLAHKSTDIDLIIGGHSHTEINPGSSKSPAWMVPNALGDSVLIVQTGKYGRNIGEVVIDLDTEKMHSRLIPVNSRLDGYVDKELADFIAPYKHDVDSIRAIKIGNATGDFVQNTSLANWMADFLLLDSKRLAGKKADLAMINVGGVRGNMPSGDITKGVIMQVFPFDNREVIVELPGSKLRQVIQSVVKAGSGNVSGNVSVVYDKDTRQVKSVRIGGKPINDNKTYRLVTIDYLAKGNDGFQGLKGLPQVALSANVLYDDMIAALESGALKNKKQVPDTTRRVAPDTK